MSDRESKFDAGDMEDVSRIVLEHYIKHYDVVRMKLGHAKDATKKSLRELAANENTGSKPNKEYREIEAYEGMWDQILNAFRTAGMTEDELERIEVLLTRIPGLIKKYYDLLIEQDKVLQQLMEELDSIEYRKAIAVAKKVQSMPDALSGLDPAEFELKKSSSAFIYKVPPSKK